MQDEWLSWEDARVLLGVSRTKMTDLVKENKIEHKKDSLDDRRVLIKRESVEAIKAQSLPRKGKEV
jgi:excisionase family DNA binding protein